MPTNYLRKKKSILFNPFVPIAPFLGPLKTSEIYRFYDVFRGQRKSALETNGLTNTSLLFRYLQRIWKESFLSKHKV